MRRLIGLILAGLISPAFCQTTVKQAVESAPQPGTGVFAPGKFYSFLGVATLDSSHKPDYSACIATTIGTYQLTAETYLSLDILGGFSFTNNAANIGYAEAFHFGGAKWFGHTGPVASGEIGIVSLSEVSRHVSYGVLLGASLQF